MDLMSASTWESEPAGEAYSIFVGTPTACASSRTMAMISRLASIPRSMASSSRLSGTSLAPASTMTTASWELAMMRSRLLSAICSKVGFTTNSPST